MSFTQHRRQLKARLAEARCNQPSRTSAEAYAGMARMKELTSGMSPIISGTCSTAGRVRKG
jgi:hypothetical protein